MTQPKTVYVCNACGSEATRWQGQCHDCSAWNSLSEITSESRPPKTRKFIGYSGARSEVKSMDEVQLLQTPRFSSGMPEFDRVLGGGIVPGSVILIGGDPGIGKSSILLQILCQLSVQLKALYVTGEESIQQVTMRAKRMELPDKYLRLLAETEVDHICHIAEIEGPQIMVIDSIQTMQMLELSGAAGGVSQVRESAAYLTRFAKTKNIAMFIVGHVTKSGDVAGPRVLEHIVDSVIFIEGEKSSRFRIMRAMKNRFGAVNELGVFAMTDKGLKEIKNPSAIFLTGGQALAPGSVIMVIYEGSRPLLVEIQALVDISLSGNPRRVAVGVDQNRLAMLLAVLHRHGGVQAGDQDVFINVVGGIKVMETSADLALLLAIVSSLKNKPLAPDLMVFGEVGLAGEIRPVRNGQERLQEAHKHGFKQAIIPLANVPKTSLSNNEYADMQITGARTLVDALAAI